MGLFWQKMGFCTGPRLYVVVFAVDDVLWPVVYRHWQFIDVNIDCGGCWGPSNAESWFRAETYNIRILNVSTVFSGVNVFDDEARFCRVSCWVSYLLTRRVIAESVFLMKRRVFAKSVLLSQTDSLLTWTLTATVAEGPRDAESWFRAETY